MHVSDGVVEEVSVYDGGSAGTAHKLRSLSLWEEEVSVYEGGSAGTAHRSCLDTSVPEGV